MRVVVLVLLGILVALAVAAWVSLMTSVPPRTAGDATSGNEGTGAASGGEGSGNGLPSTLDRVEEPTEAFANALLDCSIALRAGDPDGLSGCFAPRLVATGFPQESGDLRHDNRWVHHHGWSLSTTPAEMTREQMLASVAGFSGHFSVIEDARLKVKSSMADPDAGRVSGELKIWLVGRDSEGRREWARGKARAAASPDSEGNWRLDELQLLSMESMVAGRDLFSDVAWEAGLDATDPPFLEHPTLGLASYGAATADVDGDGLLDLLVTGQSQNALYRNRGDGTFEDIADKAWLAVLPVPGRAPLFLDYDNDGDADLFISTFAGQLLFENRRIPEGRLVFRDVSVPAGIDRTAVGFSAAAGDVNGDGYPDIYVASYNHYGQVMPDSWDAATNGTSNLLFINQGDGTFRERAREWGVEDSRWSYAASFADVEADGDLDLYVANDFGGGNGLFLNQGEMFVDAAAERGVVDGGYGMGVSFGDYDNDGDLDLHVTRMSSTAGRRILARLEDEAVPEKSRLEVLAAGNALYRNIGDGFFQEVSADAGPFSGGWAWGGGFFDLDNDGWEDLYTPNGFLSGKSMKDT